MEDLTLEEAFEKYPYLKELQKDTIFTTRDDIEYIMNSGTIFLDGVPIYIEFLKRILTDDKYYEYAYKLFKGEINNFSAAYTMFGDICNNISYGRKTIIQGLSMIIFKDDSFTEESIRRYETLKDEISFRKLLEKYQDDKYEIVIEGKNYSFNTIDLINFMSLRGQEFEKACKSKIINGVIKEHFIYAAINFFKEKRLMHDYLLTRIVLKNYQNLISLQKVDIESINKFLETDDNNVKRVHIDKELEKLILSGMPDDISDLEKAIYIYIKMCKLLTYDEQYFAANQKGPVKEKHIDINHVSEITPKNNEVVCYEFNVIYSKMLDNLDIKFETNYKNMIGNAYGHGHASLKFRCDKYLVRADSVTSILNGDMVNAKINEPLKGLVCLNKNRQTKKMFEERVQKMYQLVTKQMGKIEDVEASNERILFQLLDEYSKATTSVKRVSLKEKLSILIEKVTSTKMVGIDSISYVLHLRKILFNKMERMNNINITTIRNNNPQNDDKIVSAVTVIVLNPCSFEENPDENIYYYFTPEVGLISTSKEEIQSKFDDIMYEYIGEKCPRIPGISEDGGIKR